VSDWKSIQRHLGLVDDGVPGQGTADAVAKALGIVAAVATATDITLRGAMEIVSHEAIVQECYRDSVGVWTWSVGVTNASGHEVYPRYKDNPQPLDKCLAIYIWLLRTKYLPDVLAAFSGFPLSETQLTAALSFHYNTGAIKRAGWVASVKAGRMSQAREQFLEWRSPPEIIPRRKAERDLFFAGTWSSDGKVNVYPVAKPSYSPAWGKIKRVDITADLTKAMAL